MVAYRVGPGEETCCEHCGDSLVEGDTVVPSENGFTYCSTSCLKADQSQNRPAASQDYDYPD